MCILDVSEWEKDIHLMEYVKSDTSHDLPGERMFETAKHREGSISRYSIGTSICEENTPFEKQEI